MSLELLWLTSSLFQSGKPPMSMADLNEITHFVTIYNQRQDAEKQKDDIILINHKMFKTKIKKKNPRRLVR